MKRVSLVCSEPVRARMAGAGIRYVELAKALSSRDFSVRLYSPACGDEESYGPAIELLHPLDADDLPRIAGDSDVLIVQGHLTTPVLAAAGATPVVVDLYDPYLLENISYTSVLGREVYERDLGDWHSIFRQADFILCAGERQRLYYLGFLTAAGRVNPETLRSDPSLRELIDIVPFGVPESLPEYSPYLPSPAPDTYRILFGGLYDWYDPWPLLEALETPELECCQVIFVHNPNPDGTPQQLFEQVRQWCKRRGWGANNVEFIDWVPAHRRFDLLRDVDLLVSPHPDSLESMLSLRTRFLEAMASGCPVIATQGGAIADLVIRYNAGSVVPYGDAQALREAIGSLRARSKKEWESMLKSEQLRKEYSWHRVIEPLAKFCGNPRRASDARKATYPVKTPASVREPSPEPMFCVLLTTYNRMDILPEVLSALEKQAGVPEFELLVVDDGSNDGTAEWLRQRAFSIATRIVIQDNGGPARARNRAVQEARGRYIAFLGDDMVPDKLWLKSHIDSHQRRNWDPDLIVVGNTEWHAAITRTAFLRHLDQTGWQFAFDAIDDPENLPFNYFYGSNISIARHWLLTQPYNTEFPYPAWEDTELGYRLHRKGCRLVYEPKALAWHFHPTDVARFAVRQERAGYSGTLLGKLQPELSHMAWPTSKAMQSSRSASLTRLLTLAAKSLQHIPISLPALWDKVLDNHYAQGARRYLRDHGIAEDDFSSLQPRYHFPLRFEPGSKRLKHNTGSLKGEHWACTRGQDSPGHCIYGQDIRIFSEQNLEARFYAEIDSDAENDNIVISYDVYDNAADTTPVQLDVSAGDIRSQPYARLRFAAKRGQLLELRAYWHGVADVRMGLVELHDMASAAPAVAVKDPPPAVPRSARPLSPVPNADAVFTANQQGWRVSAINQDRMAIYFRVDPMLATSLGNSFALKLDYLDQGLGTLSLEYIPLELPHDSASRWRTITRLALSNTGESASSTVTIDKARLTGADSGADFRLIVTDYTLAEFFIEDISIEPAGNVQAEDSAMASSCADVASRFVFPGKTATLDFRFDTPATGSIVIPVYNSLKYTLHCLRAIHEFTPPIYEIIIVDNGSTDGTQQALSDIEGLRVIRNEVNTGFAKACNQGARYASTDWLVFLNNDTVPQPGWLTSLISCAERTPRVGAVGSKLIFPQTGEVQSAGVVFGKYLLPEEEFKHIPSDDPRVSFDRRVPALTGACFLFPKKLFLEFGGFDEGYVNGFEDVDICLRLEDAGYTIIYRASSEVLHYASATEGRFDDDSTRANVKLFRQRWQTHLTQRFPLSGDYKLLSSGDLPYRYDAASETVARQTGDQQGNAIVCRTDQHVAGHCAFGPSFMFQEHIKLSARFFLELPGSVDNADDEGELATVDIYDSANDGILAIQGLSRQTIESGPATLEAEAGGGQILEFRVYWHGRGDLNFAGLSLQVAD